MKAINNKKAMTDNIINTFRHEFPGLKISPGFAAEIKKYIESEPESGYGINDCYELINKISHIRKVDVKEVVREIFFILLGQYLLTKYGGDISNDTKNPKNI